MALLTLLLASTAGVMSASATNSAAAFAAFKAEYNRTSVSTLMTRLSELNALPWSSVDVPCPCSRQVPDSGG